MVKKHHTGLVCQGEGKVIEINSLYYVCIYSYAVLMFVWYNNVLISSLSGISVMMNIVINEITVSVMYRRAGLSSPLKDNRYT